VTPGSATSTSRLTRTWPLGQPVVSVDAKKNELVGQFANGGREWQPSGEPEQVNVHDFPDAALGKAIPYGVHDLGRNTGWVGVGTDHDTAAFAVQTLRRCWQQVGRFAYHRVSPAAGDLQVEPDRPSAVQRDFDELAGPAADKP
jgi:Rhodopirellula transposase DDE domain